MKGYDLKHAKKSIVLTKAFAKKAGIIGSPEYNVMLTLRKDFADYSIRYKKIKKNATKKTYKGLTFKEMERYLTENYENNIVQQFCKVKHIAECRQDRYAVVKKWFLDNFQEAYDKEIEEKNLKEEAVKATRKDIANEEATNEPMISEQIAA